jgi:hypothetical protein
LAREAEMHSAFLDAELSTLSSQYFRIINFTELAHTPDVYSGPLASFLSMTGQMKENLHAKLIKVFKGKKHHNKLMQGTHEDALRSLFSEKRQLRWPTLGGGRFDMLKLSRQEEESTIGTGEALFGYKCTDKPWLHMEWS